MNSIKRRTFKSLGDFISKFIVIFKGPTFIMTLLNTDKKFREKICLTVAIANNCYA